MKAVEIRELSLEEMERKRGELQEELFNLRFQHGIGQLENSAKLGKTRKDIARVQTILSERQMSQKGDQ